MAGDNRAGAITAVLVALIGTAGVIGAAMISNSNRHHGREGQSANTVQANAVPTNTVVATNPVIPVSPPTNAVVPPDHPVMGPLEMATNRQGDDFDDVGKPAVNAQVCAELCRLDSLCRAMTYVVSRKTCWMKTAAPPQTPDTDMVSSVKAPPAG